MPTTWEIAKAKLTVEINEGRLSDDLSAAVVHESDPIYKAVPRRNFVNNLGELRKRLNKYKTAAEIDAAGVQNDQLLFPIENQRRWAGSDAEKFLKLDIDEELYKEMKPAVLYLSRIEYTEFSLDQFRKHINQELRSRRETLYWVALKEQKKAEKEEKKAKREARKQEEAVKRLEEK